MDKQSQENKIGNQNKNKIKEYIYPEHISSIILRKLKDDAEKFLSKKEKKK